MNQEDWLDAIDSAEYLSASDPAVLGPAVALLLLGFFVFFIWNKDS